MIVYPVNILDDRASLKDRDKSQRDPDIVAQQLLTHSKHVRALPPRWQIEGLSQVMCVNFMNKGPKIARGSRVPVTGSFYERCYKKKSAKLQGLA